jgi:NAD+ synthase
MSLPPLTFLLAQLNPLVGDIARNMNRAREILQSTPASTDLIIFPELYACGYPPEDLVLRPSFMDEIERHIHDFAALTTTTHVLMPCPWRVDGKLYNAVHLIGDGKIQQTRFKHHLPNYGVFDEKRVFSSAPLPMPMPFRGHSLGVMICEDAWFPDVAEKLKAQGADILIIPNASPFEMGKTEQRLDICRARAAETGLPLIYLNQCGGQDEIVFDGASFVLNASGELILRGAEFAEDLIPFSPTHTPAVKNHATGAALMYGALTLGLRDYVRKNKFPGILLGMSGGIDSALSAAIAVDALGADAVRCVMLPSVYTSQDSLDDAAQCCAALGIELETISIREPVSAFENLLSPHFTDTTPDITHQNIQSRARGLILMALSNASGFMVLSTGNKSEIATGYATLYGDMCGGFNALKDVYKTEVYALAQWRNTIAPVIPERILTKPPTAELKPGQKDQDNLPPYDILDDILRGLIEDDLSHAAIIGRGHAPDLVARVARLLAIAEYKRRQSAPGVKVTSRAFGRERRYPMTNGFCEN